MGKGLFITATGTDVGKTYVTALIVKKLKEAGYHAGYYKAALSGAECIADSDAGYVKKVSGITQEDDTLISYLYKEAVSPHLASFVLTEYNGRIYVSARSIDEVNVQIIMERLGGGGHMNASGAQFNHTDMDEALACLKQVIDDMMERGDI